MEAIVFYIFAAVLIFSALAVISTKNPVYAVLFLILSFFNAAVIFLLLGAEFLAMLIVIVYVGAVAVLFLFVVMMLDIKITEAKKSFLKYLPAGLIIAAIILAELVLVITHADNPTIVPIEIASNLTNTEAIGQVLYTEYVYPFQISGLILFVAMVGAIVLTNTHNKKAKRQNIREQVQRSSKIDLIEVESGKGIS